MNKRSKLTSVIVPKADLVYRTISIRTDGPETIDEKNRSVEIIAATEEPAEVFDYDKWEVVDEVLVMAGAILPRTKQVPLLDTHQRYDTSSVIGSVRNLKKSDGIMPGKAFFSTVDDAEKPWTKVKEGHLPIFLSDISQKNPNG